MKLTTLGPFGPVRQLTLGGGGIGQVWGPASEDDAVAVPICAVAGQAPARAAAARIEVRR